MEIYKIFHLIFIAITFYQNASNISSWIFSHVISNVLKLEKWKWGREFLVSASSQVTLEFKHRNLAPVEENKMHSLDLKETVMLASLLIRGNDTEEDRKKEVSKRNKHFQFTFRYASVSCNCDNNRCQRSGFAIFAKRYVIGRTMICQVSRGPRLYSSIESINFTPIFLPSYSRLFYLFSFGTICLRKWFRRYLNLKCS